MADVRLRKKAPEAEKEETPTPKLTPAQRVEAEDRATISVLDIFRSLTFLFLASCALSYFVTRESLFWSVKRPQWTRLEVLQTWVKGPKTFTEAELLAYDGSNPDLPILLAINGTVYDVTPGRRHYGPGGSYHFFAGRDATRGYITGCFAEDLTADLRGVEDMYLPLDDPEIDSLYSSGELKTLKQQERRKAKLEVHKALSHWTEFFAGSRKYVKVGTVKREPGWGKGDPPKLCKSAQDGRVKRARPEGK